MKKNFAAVVVVLVVAVFLATPVTANAQQGENDSQWAPSVGFMIGELDSTSPGFMNTLMEEVTGYENVALKGRSWDVCAARGRSGHSYLRICYAQIIVKDGSTLSDDYEDAVTNGISVKGFRVERLWRLGPGSWRVAPVISLNGGLGKISGMVRLTEYSIKILSVGPNGAVLARTGVKSQTNEPAGNYLNLIGDDWTLIGGASVGLTADIGSHLTVTAGVYGLEFPGTYKGLLQVVYWPR